MPEENRGGAPICLSTTKTPALEEAGGPDGPPAFPCPWAYARRHTSDGIRSLGLPCGSAARRGILWSVPTLFPALHTPPGRTQAPTVAGHPAPGRQEAPLNNREKESRPRHLKRWWGRLLSVMRRAVCQTGNPGTAPQAREPCPRSCSRCRFAAPCVRWTCRGRGPQCGR